MKKHHVTLKQGRNRLYQQLTDAVLDYLIGKQVVVKMNLLMSM